MSASQVREFVSSALALLDAPDHHEEKMELVDSMGTPGAQGLERILEIIEMPISAEKISVALFRTKDLEFESVVLSFLKILVHEELLKRTVVFQLGNLYSSIYGESGARAVPFLEKLTSALSHYTSTNSKSPIAHEALDLLVSFLLQIVKRNSGAKFQDSFAEHISVFIGIQIMLLDLRATTTSTRLHSNLKILNRMVSNGQEMLRLSQKLAEQESKFVTPTGTILAIASLVDLPGNLSDAGPRHDNDLVGINQINILPTRSEILSVREAYMPSMLSNSDHFLQDGMSRLYDIQFRLLREDMVGPLKEAVAGAVHDIRHSVKIVKKHRGSENSLLFHEFRDVRINGVRFHKSLGMTFEISFASPVNSNKTASKKFWERTRSLSNGNLMCLILNDSDKTPDTEVIFCSVTFKDIKKLISSPDRCTVSIRLLSSGTRCEYDEMLLLRILTNQLDAYRQQCVVEYPGILYESYRPFLECLQNRHPEEAPFYDYLCGLNVRGVGKMVEVPPPFYAREKILEFDIAKISGSRESLMAPSSSRDITFLQLLKTHTTLDKEQQMAVLSAVRQELCIIQGPPGTGKSFVGVAIVSLLLSVKKEIGGGPIICVCFTNHALDQFLEHLLNRGIEKIGRIGGSSKSERLMPYNLRNLVQDVRSPATGRRKIWKTMRKIEKSVAAVEHKAKSLQSGHISWEAISDYLSVEFPHLFYQLAHPLDGDGFQIQNATNAFDFWIKGADIQVYEQPLSPIGPKTTTLKKKEPRQSNFFDIFNNLDVTEYSIQDKELDIENLSIQDSPFLPKIPEYVGFNRPIEQLMLVDDIWETSRMERQRLVDTWKVELEDEWQTDLQQANDELKKHQSQLSELRDEANRSCLSKLDVIGLTTNGMARYTTLVNSLRSKIIICEEAGEVLEAHTLTSFCPSIEHAILIGDHQQLRPKVNNFNLSLESRQGKSLRLDESLFERLCNKKWNDEDNGRPLEFPTTTLRVQRRMRPEISQLIRNTLYPDLQDDPRTFDYPDVSGMRYNLEWMSHESPEGGSDQNGQTDRSHYNKFEVKIIGALVQHLLRQFKYSMNDIAVLTPYVGQLLALREELGSIYTIAINDRDQVLVNEAQDRMRDLTTETLNARDDSPDEVERKISADKCSALTQLRLATVDNFQGEEAKVVLVSLVRSNPNGNIGFLKSFNRVNVLLSRAMHGMYIVGNVNLARKSDFWASIIRQLEMRNRIQKGFHLACPRHLECITIAEKPEDFYLKAPEGGCNLPCGGKLPCGHACTLKCHDEALHSKTACFEACLKLHKPCGHPCMQRCSDACGKCSKIVDSVQLPCGHWIQSPECWMTWTLDSVTCREVVEKKVPGCQHVIQTECFRDTNSSSFNCFELCGSTLPCGHVCTSRCFECTVDRNASGITRQHLHCKVPCGRLHGSCEHSCAENCHLETDCPPCKLRCTISCEHSKCRSRCSKSCAPCVEPCSWSCQHGHTCSMPCGAPCNRLPCDIRCEKTLSCGHRCPTFCGEICPLATYCQICCSDELKNFVVDMILFETFEHIDLDMQPVLILKCGHIFTAESLDQIARMDFAYKVDNQLGATSLKYMDSTFQRLQNCPSCRGSLVGVKRYGRINNRAITDGIHRKYYEDLALGFVSLSKNFEKVVQDMETNSIRFHVQLRALRTVEKARSLLERHLLPLVRFQKSLEKYIHSAIEESQPQQKLYQACISFILQDSEDGFTEYIEVRPPDLKFAVQGKCLRLQAYLTTALELLKMKNLNHLILEPWIAEITGEFLCNGLEASAEYADHVLQEAQKGKLPRPEVLIRLTKARLLVLLFRNKSASFETRSAARIEGKRELVHIASRIEEYPGILQIFTDQIEQVERSLSDEFYEQVSMSERLEILQAMRGDPHGGVSWYFCENQHPFSIGECGRPMEMATCPECGAQVGGLSHHMVAGVTEAAELNTFIAGQ